MKLTEFNKTPAMARDKVVETLTKNYGFTPYDLKDAQKLEQLKADLQVRRESIIASLPFNTYHKDARYTANLLLSEAVVLMIKALPMDDMDNMQDTESDCGCDDDCEGDCGCESCGSNKEEQPAVVAMKPMGAPMETTTAGGMAVSSKPMSPADKVKEIRAFENRIKEAMKKPMSSTKMAKIESLNKKVMEVRKSLAEKTIYTDLKHLIEQDLEKAETVLAARSLVDELQDMVAELSELQNERLSAIVDQMVYEFGADQAAQFKANVDGAIAPLLDQIKQAKETVNNAVLGVQGEAPMQDMGDMPTGDMATDEPQTDLPDPLNDTPAEDPTGGDDSASGPTDDPLGRKMKS